MRQRNRLTALVAMVCLASGAPVSAEQVPSAGKLDERVRFIDFAPFQVTRIAGTLRSSVQVEFASDEDIIHVAIGNAIAWEVAVKGNLLFLKPRELHDATNMHVVTQRADKTQRTYQLEIAALRPDMLAKLKPFFLVKFRYPQDEAARMAAAHRVTTDAAKSGEIARQLIASDLAGPKNYAYTIQGDAGFEPSSVFDNGKVTTFEFAGNTEIPAIFLAKDDGSETLVAKTVTGHSVVVHAQSRKFVLRRGFEVMCVFNEDFHAAGSDPGTNTTSDRVSRVATSPVPRSLTTPSPVPAKDIK
jgi:type IV secretion system protein VirB9